MLKRLLERLFKRNPQSSFEIKLGSSVELSQAPASEVTNEVQNEITAIAPVIDYPIPVEDVPDPPDQECRTHYVQCVSSSGMHKMAYHEWGDPNNQRVLICVHGLTRRGSDFTVLAKAMTDRYRVICPDIAGRGDSDWLNNPMLYGIPQYVNDMNALFAHLGLKKVDWFGTSMGGLIGIFMASQKNSPIKKMIINDVGPRIEATALKRFNDYVGKPLRFNSKKEGLIYLNRICEPFGTFTAQQWKDYNGPHLKKDGDQWVVHYDPDIVKPFAAVNKMISMMGEMMTWKAYDAINAEMLIVRGSESDLISANTVSEMCRRNPKAKSIEILGVGHAPAFITPEQVSLAREFYS
uniref:alpha/beta fold hydrolase n=1 Tax=Polynucleobacter sp. TaxID=2029855 RepID=UPI0040478B81